MKKARKRKADQKRLMTFKLEPNVVKRLRGFSSRTGLTMTKTLEFALDEYLTDRRQVA